MLIKEMDVMSTESTYLLHMSIFEEFLNMRKEE